MSRGYGDVSWRGRSFGGGSLLSRNRAMHLRYARVRYPHMVVNRSTAVVIEGFPRSANTFAVNAFLVAQDGPVSIGHHLHTAGHVVEAVRLGVPTIVLLREPEDALASLLVRQPSISAARAAAAYVRFYRGVQSARDGFVVGEFATVTSDFGSVIRRLNARFGTDFAEFEHSATNVKRCFGRIEEISRHRTGGALREDVVARPSGDRRDALGRARERIRAELASTTFAEMQALYATLCER